MKSITNRLFVFAATAVLLGTTAFGQTTTMRADVPFAFHISGGGVDAGNYVVQLENAGTGKVVTLLNNDSHRSALTVTSFQIPARPGEAIRPRLVFRCGDTGCALSEIWTLDAGYSVPQVKPGAYEYLASIPLTVQRGN